MNSFVRPVILKLVGAGGGELHRVADHVAPQPAVGGNDDGVVYSGFDFFQQQRFRVGFAEFAHGNELVVHTVVEHEQHRRIGGVVLQTEESLGGVVRFEIFHFRVGQEPLVLLAIGCEVDSPVDEKFEVRPHLVEVGFARAFENPVNKRQKPRGNSR